MQRFLRLFWVHRFRLYAVITVCLCTPLLYSSNINVKNNISALGYTVTSSNLLAQKIEYNKLNPALPVPPPKPIETKPVPEAKVKFDFTSQDVMDKLKASIYTYQSGFINTSTLKDLKMPLPIPERIVEVTQKEAQLLKSKQGKTLDDIYSRPTVAPRTNFITIPDYTINSPLVYANFDEFFAKNPDGTFAFSEKPLDSSERKSPLQQKLRAGIVCLPFSPFPGELGNSYCIGHSSNYADVISDYNEVLKPIERKGKVGELIQVYDPYGRELTFRIFETEIIESEGAQKAYLPFPDHKRVLTLQTSVVSTRNGRTDVFQRWLVKAELVCPGGEVCKE